jgi:benzoyl-CoA reductase/2-hydroxyglutaryl-CoA dehydratase subunit BcrC/BadD/HgdB
MSLMRSDRFGQVDSDDYRTLRKTLDNANLVIDDYEKTHPSVLSFVHFLKSFWKKAYRADVQQRRQKLAQNEEIKHQQTNFRKLLSWSVYYNTPFLFRNPNILSAILSVFGCTRKGAVLKKTETYAEWVTRNVSNPLAKDFSPKH